ncbi:hypothetical protein JCM8097_001583 [Rhodosporidiobolus ruineniae]
MLHTTSEQYPWMNASYALTAGLFVILGGRLGDKFSAKLTYLFGYFLLCVFNLAIGFVSAVVPFDVLRALAGVGAALLVPNSLALLARQYEPGLKRTLSFAILGAFAPIGFQIHALFASLVIERIGARWIFWLEAICSAVFGILSAFFIPQDDGDLSTPIDWIGSVLGLSGLTLFNFAWNQAPLVGWQDPYVPTLLGVGILLTVLFFWWEKRAGEGALVPTRIFTKDVIGVCVALWWGWMSFGCFLYYTIGIIRDIRGYHQPLSICAQMITLAPMGIVGALSVLWFKAHVPGHWTLCVAMGCFFVPNLLMGLTPRYQTFWAMIFPAELIVVFGSDLSFASGALIITNSVPPSMAGIAGGLVNLIVNYSMSIGLGIAGTVEVYTNRGGEDVYQGYRSAFCFRATTMADMSTPINLPLLKLISDARSTYGLRHQDYGRYRSHCVAKVHHLRKSIGLNQTAGKSRKYQKKEVLADKVNSDKHLQIVLFDAERCWAQAQVLKAESSDPAASSSAKHHFAKRLSKAASRAQDLLELARTPSLSSRLSASDVGQIQAYALLLSGAYAFERGKHDAGLETLSAAYEVLSALAASAQNATDEALANERLDEVEPMLRFCAYRLGKDTAAGVASIAKDVSATALPKLVPEWDTLRARLEEEGKAGKKETVEVRWRGELIPVRNAELVGAAVKVQEALASLEKDQATGKKGGDGAEGKKKEGGPKKDVLGARRMGTYDKALLALSDAEAVASQLVEDNKIALKSGSTQRSDSSSAPLALFHAYVQYHLLTVRTQRDLLLISSTLSKLAARETKIRHAEELHVARTQARDPAVAQGKLDRLRAKTYPGLVKVYDGVLLSLEAMRDMEVVEQDDELATTAEARIAYIRAERCKYLSRGHALAAASPSGSSSSAYPSALTLLARAKLYSRQARSAADALASITSEESDEDLVATVLPLDQAAFDRLDAELELDEQGLGKGWYAATGGDVHGADEAAEDVAALSLSAAGGKKGKGKEGKKGPAFYDVAFNYVAGFDFDAIAVKAGLKEAEEEEEVAPVKGQAQAESDEEMEQEEEVKEEKPKSLGWGFGLFGR